MTALRIAAFDHLVLNVADAEASAQWYEDKLGLQPVRLAEWRAGEAPFVSLRVDEGTIIDLQETARTGENCGHICLVLGEDVDLAAVAESGELETLGPPRRLFGARGWGQGFYVRDPDGNVVELRQYPASPLRPE